MNGPVRMGRPPLERSDYGVALNDSPALFILDPRAHPDHRAGLHSPCSTRLQSARFRAHRGRSGILSRPTNTVKGKKISFWSYSWLDACPRPGGRGDHINSAHRRRHTGHVDRREEHPGSSSRARPSRREDVGVGKRRRQVDGSFVRSWWRHQGRRGARTTRARLRWRRRGPPGRCSASTRAPHAARCPRPRRCDDARGRRGAGCRRSSS